MSSVNKVILIGHLGRDPETRYTANGDAIANIALATSESWKDKTTGEKREQTEWHRISFFGKLAEISGQYLKKGSQVYVEGSLRTRKYTDKDGVEKYVTEIRGDEMRMLGGRPDGAAPQRQASRQDRAPALTSGGGGGMDDDIPFDCPYRGKYALSV